MSSTVSRRRVAAALAAALLAGVGTAWATRPDGSAASPLAGQLVPSEQATASLSPRDTSTTRDPDRTLPWSESPVAPPTDGEDPAPRVATREVATPEPPTSVIIARIGVRMPILPVGVASDGQMALPPDPDDVGWYRFGPRPGDRAGATVLAAHIDSKEYGIGAMARLGELRAGDVITVVSRGKSQRYAVSSTRHLEKASLDIASLFARTGPPRLHLITCGGDFDRKKRQYEQNIVVLAFPVP